MRVTGTVLALIISSSMYHLLAINCYNCADCKHFQCLNCTSDAPLEGIKVLVDVPTSITYDQPFNVTCKHNLPSNLSVSFQWLKDNKTVSQNQTMSLQIKEKVTLKCTVLSQCGDFSSEDHTVSLDDQITVILVVCGTGAVFIILVAYCSMKIKMKQISNNREAIRRQRETNEVTTTTTSSYW